MASARQVFTEADVVWFKGRAVKLVPSVDLDLFDTIADMVTQEVERALGRSVGTAVHGAGVAGAAAAAGEDTMVTWVAVGGEGGDGRNCVDCLALHGTQMRLGEYLDRKYTTRCNGNCRCVYAPVEAVGSESQIEAIATSELVDEATIARADSGYTPTRPDAGTTQPRAKIGGEYGPNGEWYKGGAFIATTDLPKKEIQKAAKMASATTAVGPNERRVLALGEGSIYQRLQVGALTKMDSAGRVELLESQYVAQLTADQYAALTKFIELYNKGERLFALQDFPSEATLTDLAKYISKKEAIPGVLKDRVKMIWPSLDLERWNKGK